MLRYDAIEAFETFNRREWKCSVCDGPLTVDSIDNPRCHSAEQCLPILAGTVKELRDSLESLQRSVHGPSGDEE